MTLSTSLSSHILKNRYAKHESCQSFEKTAKLERKELSRGELEAIIDVLPEMNKLEVTLDHFYWGLHDDSKLLEFSDFFSQVLTNNPTIFKSLDNIQKAQILFDKYRELTLTNFLMTKDYQDAYQSLQRKIKEFVKDDSFNQIIIEKVDKSLKSRINYLHSGFIAAAIAHSLGVGLSKMNFSSKYQHRDLNLSNVNLSLLKG